MSPLEVSISTSAPSVAGARMRHVARAGLDVQRRDVAPQVGRDRSPLPVSSESLGERDARSAGSRPSRYRRQRFALELACRSRRPSRCRSRAIAPWKRDDLDVARARCPRSDRRPTCGHLHRARAHVHAEHALDPGGASPARCGRRPQLAVHVRHASPARPRDRPPTRRPARHLHRRSARASRPPAASRWSPGGLRPDPGGRAARARRRVAEGAVVPHPELGGAVARRCPNRMRSPG